MSTLQAGVGDAAGSVTVTGTEQRRAWQARVLPAVEQVRPGLWSIPVPIPDSPLRYTLSYAFVQDSVVVLVDPGWDTAKARDALAAGLAEAGASVAAVTGVVVTHIHPDHHGLSGYVRDSSGAWIAMHPVEAETLPGRIWRDRAGGMDETWLRLNGVPEDEIGQMSVRAMKVGDLLGMAEPDRYLNDGDALPIAGREVRAIWTPGHTPGHLCLHDARAGVLLTGDHLLPRISPNIGVHSSGEADPLTDYLASLAETAGFAADEALPAHEYRFRDIDTRAAQIIAHHAERSAEILAALDRLDGQTAFWVAGQLTWSRGWAGLHGRLRRMALAETIAHLRHLATAGEVVEEPANSKRWYRTKR